ncbi:MAG: hypothetical protein NZ517_06005 [Candidatus Nitrosocaldus sp.]|nr:hypothetical protein [Candidatus Nitrosocaldus sp.]
MITVKRRAPEFILSFLAGLIILAQGLTFIAGIFIGLPQDEMLDNLRSMLGDEEFRFMLIRAGVAGVSTGAMIMLLAVMIERRREESKRWGVMIIILCIISVLGVGFINIGMLPGIILGLIGGALAVRKGKGSIFAEGTGRGEPAPEGGGGGGVGGTGEVTSTTNAAGAGGGGGAGAGMIYTCQECNLEFASDEELRRHAMSRHMTY